MTAGTIPAGGPSDFEIILACALLLTSLALAVFDEWRKAVAVVRS